MNKQTETPEQLLTKLFNSRRRDANTYATQCSDKLRMIVATVAGLRNEVDAQQAQTRRSERVPDATDAMATVDKLRRQLDSVASSVQDWQAAAATCRALEAVGKLFDDELDQQNEQRDAWRIVAASPMVRELLRAQHDGLTTDGERRVAEALATIDSFNGNQLKRSTSDVE